jgi:methylated-DNA-protein-cysteine methyltransferase-like protein
VRRLEHQVKPPPPPREIMNPRFEVIWEAVRDIPKGRVSTYGEIATLVGMPGRARLVGTALRNLPESSLVPWYRVLGAGGRISIPNAEGAELQRALLEDEGVEFRGRRVDLRRFGWRA